MVSSVNSQVSHRQICRSRDSTPNVHCRGDRRFSHCATKRTILPRSSPPPLVRCPLFAEEQLRPSTCDHEHGEQCPCCQFPLKVTVSKVPSTEVPDLGESNSLTDKGEINVWDSLPQCQGVAGQYQRSFLSSSRQINRWRVCTVYMCSCRLYSSLPSGWIRYSQFDYHRSSSHFSSTTYSAVC